MSEKAGLALYHPPTWREEGEHEDVNILQVQVFVLGQLPDGKLSLSIYAETPKQLAAEGWPDCRQLNANSIGTTRPIGPFEIGGREGFRSSTAPPSGYQGDPFVGTDVNVEAAGRCFRFEAFSPNKADWDKYSETVLRVLSTVTFRE